MEDPFQTSAISLGSPKEFVMSLKCFPLFYIIPSELNNPLRTAQKITLLKISRKIVLSVFTTQDAALLGKFKKLRPLFILSHEVAGTTQLVLSIHRPNIGLSGCFGTVTSLLNPVLHNRRLISYTFSTLKIVDR